MQLEERQQAITQPEIVPQSESKDSRRSHGGKRPGAGRKPKMAKLMFKGTSRATLQQALANVDPQLVSDSINKLLESKKEIIWLQTLNFIYDRMLGKAKQDVNVSGGFVHAHVRDPHLALLPKEALESLARSYDEIVAKYALQDGPGNQAVIKPAIEAEIVTDAA
jgi:hypothetical protein